ncbi:MAG: tetratricopeptide repeat protein [Leptolyngbya sp.]|nr:tetratricopeptide repeat protein [Candidatus Melainabacteria bacterium]
MMKNPFLLVILLLSGITAIRSFDFQTLSIHSIDVKSVFVILLVGGCLILVMLFSFAGTVPMMLALNGRTELGETLSRIWIKFTKSLGAFSEDYIQALTTGAHICRLNGNLDTSLSLCQIAETVLAERSVQMKSLPEPTNDKDKHLHQMLKNIESSFSHQLAEVLMAKAWNHYDKGDFEPALAACEQTLAEIQKLKEKEFIVGDINNAHTDSRKRMSEIGTLELIGLIKSKQRELLVTRDIFEKTRLLRAEIDKAWLDENWHTNYAFALMNLNRNEEALDILSQARSTRFNKMSPHGQAMLLVNLGETNRRLCHFNEAKKDLTEALKIQKKYYPPRHYSLAETNSYLEKLSNDMGGKASVRL